MKRKTLTATLTAYLNALPGKGVHIITVNDYLAKRDAEFNRPLFEYLGLSVAFNIPGMNPEDKKAAYQADITYGTNTSLVSTIYATTWPFRHRIACSATFTMR